jgi:hypothetical protein
MRAIAVATMIALFHPAIALAQAAPSAATPAAVSAPADSHAATRGHDMTRDAYIEQAKERAAKRFDRMDGDHNGVLTSEERHAYREAHHRTRKPAAH